MKVWPFINNKIRTFFSNFLVSENYCLLLLSSHMVQIPKNTHKFHSYSCCYLGTSFLSLPTLFFGPTMISVPMVSSWVPIYLINFFSNWQNQIHFLPSRGGGKWKSSRTGGEEISRLATLLRDRGKHIRNFYFKETWWSKFYYHCGYSISLDNFFSYWLPPQQGST